MKNGKQQRKSGGWKRRRVEEKQKAEEVEEKQKVEEKRKVEEKWRGEEKQRVERLRAEKQPFQMEGNRFAPFTTFGPSEIGGVQTSGLSAHKIVLEAAHD